jgi:serine/threonine protein kinase
MGALDGEAAVESEPAELREVDDTDLPGNKRRKMPREVEAANVPIVSCGYCETRIPQLGMLLETDGCPCCGARVGLTQLEMIATQPDWVIESGTFLVEERVHGPFGVLYHGRRIATSEPITARLVAADCQWTTKGKSLLSGLWQAKEFKHPAVASFEEICLHQEDVYLIGPRQSGISLADQFVRTRMTPLQIAKLGHDLAKCLEAAHEAGILHRDLKPANVLVSKDGKPKVLGFGLPRRKTGGGYLKGPNGFVMGTVGYLAPEQAQGNGPPDPRSDIYSLGVMLFQLLTGSLPFRGTLAEVLKQIACTPLPVPSKLRKELSWEWDVLCRRSTAKKPAERYQSAGDLADALQNVARNMQRS